jgi:DNA-binding beta-propeller fold protein YncE
MRRIFVNLFAFLAIASLSGFAAQQSDSEQAVTRYEAQAHNRRGDTIWVTNRDDDTLTIFAAATGTPLKPRMTIGDAPHDVVVSARAGKGYVMIENESRVAVVSASTLDVLYSIPLPARPHHAEVGRDGRTIYIGLFNTNQVAAIDTATDAVRIYTSSLNSAARAHAPHPSRDGTLIFVPHEMGDEVSVLDAESGDPDGLSIFPGSQPSEVLPTHDGERLFVSMRGEGRVEVIDLATRLVIDGIDVGPQPESLILTQNEHTLIVSMRGSPATLAFVDARDLTTPPATVQIAGTGTSGDLAVLSPQGRYVYATFDSGMTGRGGVAVVDVQTRQVVDTWASPASGRPHGIAYSTTNLNLP